jgi:hypothetical protein
VIDIDTIVDDGHRDPLPSDTEPPRPENTRIRTAAPTCLPGVVEVPLVGEERVVRSRLAVVLLHEVRLRPRREAAFGDRVRDGEGVLPLGVAQPEHVLVPRAPERLGDDELVPRGEGCHVHPGPQPHHHLVREQQTVSGRRVHEDREGVGHLG